MTTYVYATPAGERASEALLDAPGSALLALDFDGTLAPIVDDSDNAYVHPDAVAALRRLGPVLGKIAIVTGRPARTAVRLGHLDVEPGLETLSVLGQYGVERWDAATGEYHVPPPPAGIDEVEAGIRRLLEDLGDDRVRVEHKGRALGVHVRAAADPDASFRALLQPLRDLAAEHDLMTEPGKDVIELRGTGSDKGAAVRALRAETGARVIAFAGDDLGDLPAFDAVDALRADGVEGLLVCSRSHEEDVLAGRADLVLDGPDSVARWLTWIADTLGA